MWICARAEFALAITVMHEANPRGGGEQHGASCCLLHFPAEHPMRRRQRQILRRTERMQALCRIEGYR
jgi:hypothetical protein